MDKPTLTFGSLFSGIGGLDLGFEQAGLQVKWQVENDGFCTKILAKRWPDAARYGDVCHVGGHNLKRVDIIAGGYPCQPHSLSGERRASEDERDLWPQFCRIIRELRPRWVVAENVLGVLSSESGCFFGRVLRDLAKLRYDAEWQVLPAAAFGAPHLRDRVFLVAYPHKSRWTPVLRHDIATSVKAYPGWPTDHLDTPGAYLEAMEERLREPALLRSYDGISDGVDRLERLGNAVVPQVAEFVGRCIVAAEAEREAVA